MEKFRKVLEISKSSRRAFVRDKARRGDTISSSFLSSLPLLTLSTLSGYLGRSRESSVIIDRLLLRDVCYVYGDE
jgi:hypothetical protein